MSSNHPNRAFEQNHGPSSPPSSCILLLNGFPGVGKLTIARAVGAKLETNGTPYRLLDNHLLIDPVIAIEPLRNKAHYDLRKAFRNAAFEGLKVLDEERLVIIFTAALATSQTRTPYNDIDQFAEYVGLAGSRGVPLVVVNIVCDLGTNFQRLCSPERNGAGGKTKLVDTQILKKITSETSLLTQEQVMAHGEPGSVHHFELDTSDLPIEQAAQKVSDFLCEVEVQKRMCTP